MPVRESDSFLQGVLGGQKEEQQIRAGQQAQSLEQLMSKNRIEEGMTEIPEASVHQSLRAGMAPGSVPGSLRVRTTALPSLEKASEAITGRDNRVATAKGMKGALLANAQTATGPQRGALLAAAANAEAMSGNGDVPQAAIDQWNKLLETKIVMGKPGEQPIAERTGENVGKPVPYPDMSTMFGGSMTPPPGYQPPELGMTPTGPNMSMKPLPAPLYAMHQALLTDPRTAFGTQPYYDAMAAFAKLLAVQEGGNVVSPVAALTGRTPGGAPPAQAPAAGANAMPPPPAGTIVQGPPRPANNQEIKDLTAANTAHMQMGDVLKSLEDPAVSGMMGGLWQNPPGAWARMKGEGGIKVPFTGTSIFKGELPPAFVNFQSQVAVHRQLAQKVLEGMRPNFAQIAALAPAMIDVNDPPPVAAQKARAWQQYYQDNSAVINSAIGQSRRQQITPIQKDRGTVAPPTSPQQVGGSPASVGVAGTEWIRRPDGSLGPK